MLRFTIIGLISFSNYIYCLNTWTSLPEYDVISSTYKYSVFECNSSTITNTRSVKSLKCHSDFLSQRTDSLKQWKRRRRTVDKLQPDINENYDNKMVENENIEELKKSKASLELISKFVKLWPVDKWSSYGLFTEDYLLSINNYWLQFPPPDPLTQYVFGSTYIVLGSIGCFGNILVLLMYFRCRTLRTPGNILVANLALSDLLMLAKTPIFIVNSFNLGPVLGKTACVVYGFVGGWTGTTSIGTLTAIALDRYWAVVRPLEPLRALTAIRARLLAIGAWLYALIFAIIPALDIGYGRYVPEGYLTSCSFDYLTEDFSPRCFIFIFFCAAWLAPFCTISFCYISIFRVVVCNRNMSSNNNDQNLSSRHIKEHTKRKAEIKLAFLVMAVIALFFVSWTPYAVVALLGITGKKELLTPITSMIPALFCKTAACINPFIYIITHPKFRNEFKKIIFREKSKRRSGTFKTIGYSTDTSKMHRCSKDLSDTDVEVLEMKDIPYQTDEKFTSQMKTISSRVIDRENSQKSISLKSFEGCVVSPPSWYCKPQFARKKSFHRHSTCSNITLNTDPTI